MGKPSLKKIGILSSSRADYGIYNSLIDYWKNENWLKVEFIIFGSHLIEGNIETIKDSVKSYSCKMKIVGKFQKTNTPFEVVKTYAQIIDDFSVFWRKNIYDCIVCIGDRFEMSAAVQSTIPFHQKIIHIHGGETTLGAIDNIYRHQITSASKLHFTSSVKYANRVIQIIGSKKNIFSVGSLSISDLDLDKIVPWKEISNKYNIPKAPFILVTLHPETDVTSDFNNELKELSKVFYSLMDRYLILITGTNSDQNYKPINLFIRNLEKNNVGKVKIINSMGRDGYFSALKNCSFLIGNTSSGIIEAASFKKFVINIGKRQEGRMTNPNIFSSPFNSSSILSLVNKIENLGFTYKGRNIFYKKNTVIKINLEIKKFLKC